MAKKGLGKGLDALFAEDAKDGVIEVKLTEVVPNRSQPREFFDEDALSALSDSIKEYGVIQPIIVNKKDTGYIIVAGERRWRAAKKAGLKTIPVIVREYDARAAAEIALVENLQREDLNPIEVAEGYRSLMDEYNLTQEEISARLGKSRSAVANSVRLLSLDGDTKKHLIAGDITEGHARCALSLPQGVVREFFVNQIIEQGLNVRQAELLAKDLSKTPSKKEKEPVSSAYKIELERIGARLEQRFGTKVSLSGTQKKGKLVFEYYGDRDLERLLALLERRD
ncbi:MAG: ParB/RepB/Spo0J family partition protein [Firmicutes bacterium]|nr:ParB/RepB/Spo0J family partition protein [Bacillota bacterium]HAL63027.1 chromosome partitioning protein ParB [Clostridiales bacterium]